MKGGVELAVREVPYRDDIVAIDHPIARFMAAADPTTVLGLLNDSEEVEMGRKLLRAIFQSPHPHNQEHYGPYQTGIREAANDYDEWLIKHRETDADHV